MPIEKSMMLVSSQREGAPTFRLIPLTQDCPYGEVVYIPQAKVLAIFQKYSVEGLHVVPKLDDNGDPKRAPKPRADGNPYMQERKVLTIPQDCYISNPPEIDTFIALFAINPEFDYKVFMTEPKAAIIEQPGAPKIILPN